MTASISSLGTMLHKVTEYTYIESPITRVAWSALCCLAALYTQPVLKVLFLAGAALVWVSPTEPKAPPVTPHSEATSGSDADDEGEPVRRQKRSWANITKGVDERSWAEVVKNVDGGFGPQPGKPK